MRVALRLAAATTVAFMPTSLGAQVYAGARGGAIASQHLRNIGNAAAAITGTAAYPTVPAGTSLIWLTRFVTGFDVSGQAGYKFRDGLRVELEGGYAESPAEKHVELAGGQADVDNNSSPIQFKALGGSGNRTTIALMKYPGDVTTIYAFGNLFYDINRTGRLSPYFGFGIGAERTSAGYSASNVRVIDDHQARFAYQLMGGATFKLSPAVDVFAQYTWRATPARGENSANMLTASLDTASRQSIMGGGVRIDFGGTR